MRKYNTAIKNYDGFLGAQSLAAVWDSVPEELKERCTGKELGLIMSAINKAYHAGRASTGAEMIDSDCVYVNGFGSIEFSKVSGNVTSVILDQDLEDKIKLSAHA